MSLLLRSSGLASTGGGATFSPLDLTPALWLLSDTRIYTDAGTTPVVSDADLVYQWSDFSGSGNHQTQATSARRPLWKTAQRGAKPAVRFVRAGTDYTSFSSLALGTANTSYWLLKLNNNASTQVLLGGAAGSYGLAVDTGGHAGSLYYSAGGSFVGVDAQALTGVYYVLSVVRSGTTVSFWDGVGQIGANQTLALNNALSVDTLGAYTSSLFPADVDLAQLLLFTSAHNATQRAQMVGYLSAYQ